MEIDSHASVVGRDEVLVDAEPETVWQFLGDAGGWPEWRSGITAVSVDGTLTAGTTFSWTVAGADTSATVGDVVPGRALGWETRSAGLVAVQTWVLDPYERSTLVRVAASWEGDAVGGSPEEQAALEQSLRSWLQDLKAIAEAPAMEGHA